MKKLFTVFVIGIIFITSLSFLGIDTMAYLPPQPFEDFGYDKDGKVISEYSFVWRKTVVDTDFIVDKTKHLIIKPIGDSQTDARVTVNNGAVANIKGDMFIERGGTLEIKDGTVIINGGNITNCGTIKIGKKGTLKILKGTLNSTAAGNIHNDGKITCLKTSKNLNGCFKGIEKYDENFNLSDYSLSINSDGKSANVTANYCIDDIMTDYNYKFIDNIMTDYKYKFSINTDSKKIKVTHTRYKLKTVYDSNTSENLRKRVLSFEDNNRKYFCFKFDKKDDCYWIDYGYTYNFKTDELIYNAKWFTYDDENEKFIENNFSGKA